MGLLVLAAVAISSSARSLRAPPPPPTALPTPGTMIWRGASLAARRGDSSASTQAAVASLLKHAQVALTAGPFAVTDKSVPPPSGSKHDYWSVASYFWPCNVACNHTLWTDCSRWCMPPMAVRDRKCVPMAIKCDNNTGLPWASHDGYPRDADQSGRYLKGDRPRADGVTLNTATLVLAWWFSSSGSGSQRGESGSQRGEGGSQYLERAALLLRTFFLDPSTRMNPNMKFAQGVPGRFDGGVGGTVDFGRLWMLLDAVRLMETDSSPSSPWTQQDRAGMRDWLAELLDWWMGSPDGRQARNITNNIGNAYDVQAMAMATFLGNASAAASLVNHDVRRRVDEQIAGSGALPKEDARSNSFGYHVGNLIQFLNVAAAVNSSVEVVRAAHNVPLSPAAANVGHYISPKGGSIQGALNWLAPFCKDNATTWPFRMTNNSGEELKSELPRCRLVYNWAGLVYGTERYAAVAATAATAADGYLTGGLGLSTLEYNRLLYSC
jgi:hypothetical protein